MSKELVISQKDFNEVGINAQLSVNDLVEVVANDIYEKYISNIHEMVQKGNDLKKKYYSLFDPELNKMKLSLKEFISKDEPVSKVDEEGYDVDGGYENVTQSFSRSNEYWQGGVDLKGICLTEKDKGTSVSNNSNYLSMPSLKNKNVQVKLTISSDKENKIKEVSVGKIKGEINTSTEKKIHASNYHHYHKV